jgi:hypothetical protein
MASNDDGELWISFVFDTENPEGESIGVRMKGHRSLLSSHESAKAIIPWLLSHTTLPEQCHHCPEFITYVSEYVCSLPSHERHLYVSGHVAWDEIDPSNSIWRYICSTEDWSCAGEQVMVMLHCRWSESAVQALALEVVKIEETNSECAICLQDLLVGAEAAKLPCSHVYHCGCIVKWFDRSNQCPLCRSQVV